MSMDVNVLRALAQDLEEHERRVVEHHAGTEQFE
jgi:hypothetical protein